jgi:hypothetical protein
VCVFCCHPSVVAVCSSGCPTFLFMQATVTIAVAEADQEKLEYQVPVLSVDLECRSIGKKGRAALTVAMFSQSSDNKKLDPGAPFASNSELVTKAGCLATSRSHMIQEHETDVFKLYVNEHGHLVFKLPESSFRPDGAAEMKAEPIQVQVNGELLLGGGHIITVNASDCTLKVTCNGDSIVGPVWRSYNVNVTVGSKFKVCLSPCPDVLLCLCVCLF